jgi:hypothetical protein
MMSPKNDNEYLTKIRKTTFLCGLLACVYFGLMIWSLILLKKSDFLNGHLLHNYKRKVYGYVTGSVFLIDSIGLLYTTCALMRNLKRDFSSGMHEEAKVLKHLFIIFTISYFIRTFMLFS